MRKDWALLGTEGGAERVRYGQAVGHGSRWQLMAQLNEEISATLHVFLLYQVRITGRLDERDRKQYGRAEGCGPGVLY